MRRACTPVLLALFALGCLDCSGCTERKGPEHVVDLAPPDAAAVVWVTDLTEFARGVDAFATRATRKAGASTLKRFRTGATSQLGIDPLNPSELPKVGVDPNRGAVLFGVGVPPVPILGLGINDKKTFDGALQALIKKLDGADQVKTKTTDGVTYTMVGRPFGTELVPVLVWKHVGPWVLAARGDGEAALVQTLKRLEAKTDPKQPRPTLSKDPAFARMTGKVFRGQVVVFVRGSLASELGGTGAVDAATAITLSADGAEADSFLDLPGFEGALAGEPTLELMNLADDDAVAVMATRAARPNGVTALEAHPAGAKVVSQAVAQLNRATGLDTKKDVLPLFAGNLVASLHLHDLQNFSARLRTRSLRTALEMVHFVIVADVKDPKAMRAVLDKSQEALGERGVKIRTRRVKVGDATADVFEPDRDTPRLGWALAGNRYIYAAGVGRIDKAVARVAAPSGLADAVGGGVGGKLARDKGATVAVVRGGTIADQAKTLKLGGASGLGLAAIVTGALEVVRTLDDVAIAVTGEKDGLRVKIRQRIK